MAAYAYAGSPADGHDVPLPPPKRGLLALP
jgi:hypothetical protein